MSTIQLKFGERLNTNRLLSPSILGTTRKYKLFWSEKNKVQASQEGLPPLSFGLYGEGSLSEECGAVKLVQPYFSLDYTCEENVSSENMLTKLISARA